jgi:hypothetical protein
MFEQIIDAATVRGREDELFCIGPFSRRVSFVAQQYRALNLVWALHHTKRIKAADKVAVIGGGLAGVTAAAGFASCGCTVHLFDRGTRPLPRQRLTTHRMIHPSINLWPRKPLDSTTEFPFLEWYAGVCGDVAKRLGDLVDGFQGVEFFPETEVTDTFDLATDLLGIQTAPKTKTSEYRLALLVVGFGSETVASDFPPRDYWSPDNLENLRDTKPSTTFIVSGCGDGGLIDALRIAFVEFERGHLTFLIAEALTATAVARVISDGEEIAKKKRGGRARLPDVYLAAAQSILDDPLYADVKLRLTKALWSSGHVFLFDKALDSPYEGNAAPIHKLLVAFAARSGKISFNRGEVAKQGDRVVAGGKSFPPLGDTEVIIRHGAVPNFGRLLTKEQQDDLRTKQSILLDYHADQAWTGSFPVQSPIVPQNPSSQAFIADRLAIATKALKALGKPHNGARLSETAGAFSVEYDGPIPKGAPSKLFGIAVKSVSTEIVRGLV